MDVSLKDGQGCAITDSGAIMCWGDGNPSAWVDVRQGVPSGKYLRVYVGGDSACALREDGVAKSRGDDSAGQSTAPATAFVALATDGGHACGLTAQGSIECWGSNMYGESNPKAGPFTRLLATEATTCGLHTNGRLECWGMLTRPAQ
jgi:hypothetical protein